MINKYDLKIEELTEELHHITEELHHINKLQMNKKIILMFLLLCMIRMVLILSVIFMNDLFSDKSIEAQKEFSIYITFAVIFSELAQLEQKKKNN